MSPPLVVLPGKAPAVPGSSLGVGLGVGMGLVRVSI